MLLLMSPRLEADHRRQSQRLHCAGGDAAPDAGADAATGADAAGDAPEEAAASEEPAAPAKASSPAAEGHDDQAAAAERLMSELGV
jgi:hypothetical protein